MPERKRTTRRNDAITLLKEDHRKVKAMLEDLVSGEDSSRSDLEELCGRIETELKIHTEIEEKHFYPAFKEAAEKEEDQQLFHEATEEHHAVDLILEDLRKAEPGSPQFMARAKVLDEMVRHHIKEEEREMMPRAKKLLGAEQLVELGSRMQEMKGELEPTMVSREH